MKHLLIAINWVIRLKFETCWSELSQLFLLPRDDFWFQHFHISKNTINRVNSELSRWPLQMHPGSILLTLASQCPPAAEIAWKRLIFAVSNFPTRARSGVSSRSSMSSRIADFGATWTMQMHRNSLEEKWPKLPGLRRLKSITRDGQLRNFLRDLAQQKRSFKKERIRSEMHAIRYFLSDLIVTIHP